MITPTGAMTWPESFADAAADIAVMVDNTDRWQKLPILPPPTALNPSTSKGTLPGSSSY